MEIISVAGLTDVGKSRQNNQDELICQHLAEDTWNTDGMVLLAAIDGVGGYAGGDIAASIAQKVIIQYFSHPSSDILTMLKEAIVNANNAIFEERGKQPDLARMCCVLTVAVADVKKQKLSYVHVGDTRIYLFREGNLLKLSKDQSVVGQLEDSGELDEASAMDHPQRNEILNNAGSERREIDDPDFFQFDEVDFLPQDVVFLCSDGLTDMLTRAQITDILIDIGDISIKTQQLIDKANHLGGNDNITVVIAQNNLPVQPVIKPEQPQVGIIVLQDNPLDTILLPPAHPKYQWVKIAVTGLFLVTSITIYTLLTRPDEKLYNVNQDGPQTQDTTYKVVKADSINYAKDTLILKSNTMGDTLLLDNPINIKDTIWVTGNKPGLILMPKTNKVKQFAFSITPGACVIIENLKITGFEQLFKAPGRSKIILRNIEYLSPVAKTDTLKK